MAYSRNNKNKTSEDFDKHLKLDDKLDSHSKPVKIGEDVTGLQLSDKDVKIENDLTVGKDLTIENDISVTGQVATSLKLARSLIHDGDYLEIITDSGGIQFWKVGTYGGAIFGDGDDFVMLGAGTSNIVLKTFSGGDTILDPHSGITKFKKGGDADDLCTLTVAANGVTTITTNDSDGALGHLMLNPDGNLILDPVSQKVIINATDGLYLDGGGDTYIYESVGDTVRFVVGGDIMMQMLEDGADGNRIIFQGTSVGFAQIEPTYDATTTPVDFRHSNKQLVTFDGGNITNLAMYFPDMSGNFVLLLKQDGTGSRTVTNYKVFELDESVADGEAGVKFAGGSNPTLTTDANHVDILSFYWDADNEIAYGVATLDFQF